MLFQLFPLTFQGFPRLYQKIQDIYGRMLGVMSHVTIITSMPT